MARRRQRSRGRGARTTARPARSRPPPQFRADLFRRQEEQCARLAERLPLPQLRLPFFFTADVGPAEIELLADELVLGVGSLADEGEPITMTAPAELVADRHIVICCGTGGVGKTTTAAALAIEGARRGRNAVVVTIDPAKRLANTLGLEHLSNTAHEIDRDRWDPAGDAAPGGPAARARCSTPRRRSTSSCRRTRRRRAGATASSSNRFYRNIAGALSGTQEYMAMEKLYELHDSGGFDLIVVDTPPTRHALDFLDAPRRLTRLLDNRIFRMLMVPTRGVVRVGGVGRAGVPAQDLARRRHGSRRRRGRVLPRVRGHGGRVPRPRRAGDAAARRADETAFVLVTSPRRDAVEEAEYFAGRLADGEFAVDALVVNRVHPRYSDEDPETAPRPRAGELGARRSDAATRLAAHYANLADFEEIARARARRARRPRAPHRRRRRSRTSPSSATTSTTSPRSTRSGRHLIGRRRRFPAVTTILVAADAKWVRDLVKSALHRARARRSSR